MAGADTDFKSLEAAVARCCKTEEECGKCDKLHCLVGFAWNVAKYGAEKGMARVDGGMKMLPRSDMRVFYEDELAHALVDTLLQCKNCRDNHDQDCSVSLIRASLERALLAENLDYQGSVLGYLVELQRVNPRVGETVAAAYQQRSAAAAAKEN